MVVLKGQSRMDPHCARHCANNVRAPKSYLNRQNTHSRGEGVEHTSRMKDVMTANGEIVPWFVLGFICMWVCSFPFS